MAEVYEARELAKAIFSETSASRRSVCVMLAGSPAPMATLDLGLCSLTPMQPTCTCNRHVTEMWPTCDRDVTEM